MHQLLPDVSFWPPFVSFFLTRILNSAPFGTPGYQGFGIHTNFTWRPTPTEAFTSAHMWWSSQHIWPPWHLSRDTQVGFRSHLYSIFSFMLASGTFTCVQGFSSTALKPDDVILAMATFAQNLIIRGLSPKTAIIDAYGGETRVLQRTPVVWVESIEGRPRTQQVVFGTLHDMPWGLPPPAPCKCLDFSGWHSRVPKTKNPSSCESVKWWKCKSCGTTIQHNRPSWAEVADEHLTNVWVHPILQPKWQVARLWSAGSVIFSQSDQSRKTQRPFSPSLTRWSNRVQN